MTIEQTNIESAIQSHLMEYFKTTAADSLITAEFCAIYSPVGDAYHNAVNFFKANLDRAQFITALRQIDAFYQQHGTNQYCIWHYTHNELQHHMSEDFRIDPTFRGLFCELGASPYVLTEIPNIYYQAVSSAEMLDEFFVPFKAGFAFSDDAASIIKNYYQKNFSDARYHHYIAYHEQSPIGSASLFINDDIAGLYNLAVLPSYRSQGIGKNLQKIRLNKAITQGIQAALIQATPTTEGMTKQLTFETYTTITPYVHED